MRRVTGALLAGAYICLAAIAALTLGRSAGGWGAGVAGFFGVLGCLFAVQGIIARAMANTDLKSELANLREAHLILADQLTDMHQRLGGLVETVTTDALQRSEELTTEVRVLESLVQTMSDSLQERMSQQRSAPYVGHPNSHGQHAALLETVREALAENRVDLYLQPVVSLPQRRTVFYESFSRLRDGSGRVMMPAEYLSVAEPEGLMSAIDNLLLFRCVQIVRRLAKNDRKVGIFCNVALGSLADEVFFPQFLEFLSENKDMASGLIFELGQSAFNQRGATEARNMAKLADLGFRFSLDKVTDLDLDFQDLSRADVKYVRVGAEMMVNQLLEVDGQLALRSLKDLAAADYADLMRRYGIEVIAEKVESERQVVDILELNIRYGQGNLFGEPRAIRDAILAEADPPADFMRTSLRRRAGGMR
jgi:cyclic-di-GMP phosphodiesterase TipF (flagellum assembly factor)